MAPNIKAWRLVSYPKKDRRREEKAARELLIGEVILIPSILPILLKVW